MNALRLAALLVYTFGAFAYGALLVLWARELGQLGWAGRRSAGPRGEADLVNGILAIASFAWFVLHIVLLLLELGARETVQAIETATIFIAYLYPPLIMHTVFVETMPAIPPARSAGWRAALWPAYLAAVAIPSWCLLTLYDAQATGGTRQFAQQLLGAGYSALFIGAAAYSLARTRRAQSERGAAGVGHESRPLTALYALMVLLFVVLFVLSVGDLWSQAGNLAVTAVATAARSLPLLFLFVISYYENRFQFFDLFVKRGLALLLTIAVLTVWFGLVLPLLRPVATAWAAPWIFAIALVPVAIAMPPLYGALTRALDRRWLGRRFTTVEAVTRFLSGLRSATSESELVQRAEEGLAEIFSAPAAVQIGSESPVAFDVRHETHRQIGGIGQDPVPARFLMGPRASDAPYFSQDAALLRTLAEVFASALENVHLQQRRHDQEQRARELSLHASRSELKALRAQINPHFLFNALNAIAGLIHRDPAVADRTIEQLAEVFRYALRGVENEWASLEDEVDFVRAYLEVERARFGDRLEVSLDVTPDGRQARIPTMMLQTLVENAVKHGVATVRGRAFVGIDALVRDSRLVVSVIDNGPGFGSETGSPGARRSGGYGLANIRDRLSGYFGDAAQLSVSRDEVREMTVVSITLPLVSAAVPHAAGAFR